MKPKAKEQTDDKDIQEQLRCLSASFLCGLYGLKNQRKEEK